MTEPTKPDDRSRMATQMLASAKVLLDLYLLEGVRARNPDAAKVAQQLESGHAHAVVRLDLSSQVATFFLNFDDGGRMEELFATVPAPA